MATLKTNLIEPEGATTTLTVGEAGGDLIIGADSLKANLIKAKETITAFTSTGAATWTCPTGVTSVEVLTVAGGGGGGGYYYSGGGGGGGVVYDTAYTVVPAVVYDLTVGAGGGGGAAGTPGTVGSDSTWNDNAEGSGVKHTAKGGGGGSGGDAGDAATAGGSGGGRSWAYSGSSGTPSPDDGGATNQQSSGTATGGTVTSYGNIGGGPPDDTEVSGAGGGGAGAAGGASGGNSPSAGTGHGGPGGAGQLFSSFTPYGVSGYFAGGGGGGGGGYSPGGIGGRGGGGAGGAYNQGPNPAPYNGTPGVDGTGGGGGAKSYTPGGSAPDGGTGIVLLKYEQPTGGSTLFSSNGSGVVSSVNAGWGGVQVLLSTTTVGSAVANISFTSGIDSTYDEYIFEFINIHLATDNARFQFNLSTDGGSNYNVTKTTTDFRAQHAEDNSVAQLQYDAAFDLAQDTSDQPLADSGNDNDQAIAGELHLFNPASTTYIKNFYAQTDASRLNDIQQIYYFGGYGNTATAVNAIIFRTSTGNIDAGTIKMYGIK